MKRDRQDEKATSFHHRDMAAMLTSLPPTDAFEGSDGIFAGACGGGIPTCLLRYAVERSSRQGDFYFDDLN